ncbi:MAG TPA: proline--tRNA ligase [Armatimonadetes bacterium]|nr:proline--tRNA ligase [Armatimonadota bacterium]
MRASRLYVPTLKETPTDAEIPSHILLVRGGFIRRLAAGIYQFLPLGLRVLRKVERIVREEMERIGAQEVLLSALQPAEIWKESKRWEEYGPELPRLRDMTGREMCLGPTHEEAITALVRGELRSYRQLPLTLYQIQTKFRDEIRPRGGLVRAREFVMKDAYSFHRDFEDLDRTYREMHDAYVRIFERMRLPTVVVEAETGPIGGAESLEFIVPVTTGEDFIIRCEGCGYAASRDRAERGAPPSLSPPDASGEPPPEVVMTPGQRTVEEVSSFLGIEPRRLMKSLVYNADGRLVMALVRGDSELNEWKLRRLLGASEMRMATNEEVLRACGAPIGFVGPWGMKEGIEVVADYDIAEGRNWVTGANREDAHVVNLNVGRDFQVDRFADIRYVEEGDPCPRCGRPLTIRRGMEVGHIFKLGTKYSEAMGATFLDEDGKEKPFVMGCYGIGVSRLVAAIVEAHHDERGIIWPPAVAPFHAVVLVLNPEEKELMEAGEEAYETLLDAGFEVVLDDRDERAGVKFKDADLIGYPVKVVVGRKFIESKALEVQERASDERAYASLRDLPESVTRALELADERALERMESLR